MRSPPPARKAERPPPQEGGIEMVGEPEDPAALSRGESACSIGIVAHVNAWVNYRCQQYSF